MLWSKTAYLQDYKTDPTQTWYLCTKVVPPVPKTNLLEVERALSVDELAVATIGNDKTIGLVLEVLLASELGEAPLVGHNDLLASRELVPEHHGTLKQRREHRETHKIKNSNTHVHMCNYSTPKQF